MSTGKPIKAEEMAEQLHAAAVQLLRGLRRADEASGLSGPRLSALSVIVFGGPVTLGRLAEAEQVKPPTMTRLVNALEGLGLVEKRDGEDRRTVYISATTKGKRLLIKGRSRRLEAVAGLIERLNAEEQEALRGGVAVLRKMMEAE
jgi:DNA-binding MarR family transcriptional regulator